VADPDCLFCRIVAGDEPAEMVAEGDHVVAFRDKFPRAPVHVLVTAREHLPSAHAVGAAHTDILTEAFAMTRGVAEDERIADGYRVVTNIGAGGGQVIPHLHFHVLGGKQLGPVDGGT
jgi:histidine triad (HIT) family protein